MTYEMRSISPRRLSRIMALVTGALMLLFCIIAIPMFLLSPFPEEPGAPSKGLFLVFLILYPLFGALWGWIGGQISARIYNWAAKRIGGVTFDMAAQEGSANG